jgi:hypothetical protein
MLVLYLGGARHTYKINYIIKTVFYVKHNKVRTGSRYVVLLRMVENKEKNNTALPLQLRFPVSHHT